jgi:hypothetical protein
MAYLGDSSSPFERPLTAAAIGRGRCPPLRRDALKAEFAGFGEHDLALGGDGFAEQDPTGAADEPPERLLPLFDGRRR